MTKPLMNEATVRAEILDPLVRMLGYEFNTDMNVIREHQFIYPKVSLGRKGKSDALIIGKPDYICQARGIANWVLEAKAEGSKLGREEDAQAYTYAAHPEIRALYYCLSDGCIFVIYKTIAPPNSPPLMTVRLDNLRQACNALTAYLSEDSLRAASILRDGDLNKPKSDSFDIISGTASFDMIKYDVSAPSYVKQAVMGQVSEQMDLLEGTIYPILSGKLLAKNGGLNLEVELGGHTQRDIDFQKLIGIDTLRFQSIGCSISEDSNVPTIFQTTQMAKLNTGDIIQSSRVSPQKIPMAVEFKISVDAFVYRKGDKVLGNFKYTTETPIPMAGPNCDVAIYIEGMLDLNIK